MSKEVINNSFAEGGEYLPLGVWTARGFDAQRIEELSRPEDREQHPVLGMTYRVRIRSRVVTGSRIVERISKRSKTTSDAKFCLPEAADKKTDATAAAPMLALEDGAIRDGQGSDKSSKTSGSSSDSSDSSDSSATKKKKHNKKHKKHTKSKKNKKDKKHKHGKKSKRGDKAESAAEKRAREAKERAAQKASEKEQATEVKTAQMLISKLAPIIASTRLVTGKLNFAFVAPMIRDPIATMDTRFVELHKLALNVVESGTGSVNIDPKELNNDVGLMRKQLALANSILSTMNKAPA